MKKRSKQGKKAAPRESVKGEKVSHAGNVEPSPRRSTSPKKGKGEGGGEKSKSREVSCTPSPVESSPVCSFGRYANRNVGLIDVRVGDLEPHPQNFRVHSDAQKKIFGLLVEELGWYDTPHVYRTKSGKLRLIDGHLRHEWLLENEGEDSIITVNETDLTEEEAAVVLATFDALGAMSTTDPERVSRLIEEITDAEDGVLAVLSDMGSRLGLEGFAPLEDAEMDHACPACGHEWNGSPSGEEDESDRRKRGKRV